jgi:hypothetical protein
MPEVATADSSTDTTKIHQSHKEETVKKLILAVTPLVAVAVYGIAGFSGDTVVPGCAVGHWHEIHPACR